jgi:hypothetical protein
MNDSINGGIMRFNYKGSLKLLWLALFLFAVAATPALGQSGRIDIRHLDKFTNQAEEVVDVTVDEALLQLAAKFLRPDKSPDEKLAKELISDLKGVYVKRFVFEKEGEYDASDVESIRSQLNSPGWTRIANVRSKRKGNYDVMIMTEGSVIRGLAVLAVEPKALTVVNVVGPIDVDKLSRIEGRFGIPRFGLERTDQPEEDGKSDEPKKEDKKPPRLD